MVNHISEIKFKILKLIYSPFYRFKYIKHLILKTIYFEWYLFKKNNINFQLDLGLGFAKGKGEAGREEQRRKTRIGKGVEYNDIEGLSCTSKRGFMWR